MCSIDYRYLRPKKAEALKAWHAEEFTERNDLQVWQGYNATIFPLRKVQGDNLLFGRGGVMDETGAYVPLSGIPGRIQNAYPVEQPRYADQKVVYCGYMVNHWGHFLVEAVTRLWYFLENDCGIDKYVFFLNENENREIKGNYRAFFELLKIWDKLEFISSPVTYREVIVPEMSFRFRNYYSPKFLSIYDTIAANAPVDPSWDAPEKIYFSRSQLAKGNGLEFGLEVLDDFYHKNGYTILYPEKVPLARMIHYIRNCDTVATLSGTLPHNMLFGRDGQKLVIVERCILNNDFQTNINRMKRLHTTYIDANIGLYTVDMCGPFIMACNPLLEQYAQDHSMVLPAPELRSKKYLDRCFVGYMKAYQDMYRYQWFMDDWYAGCADYLAEAYEEGAVYFREYLEGDRPFLPEHYFQLHYFKQFIKRALRKLGLYQ